MTNERNNPWAGLASYEDPTKSERKLKFCGRDNDIYDVTRLIDDNLLLILYGKSGIGKTSLLNAGVFPKLRMEQYLPVSIRLGTLDADASYPKAIINAIERALKEVGGSITVYNVVEEQTDDQKPERLWNFFARHRFANTEGQPIFPVVVLDQFEEVLRNASHEHVKKAQTLLNQLQYLIDENHALNDCIVDGKDYFYDFNFRFVISIREDELYLLEDNIDDLSLSMFRNCRYRLRSLSEQGATEAILVPGKDCISEEQKQAVVDRVIALSKRPQSNDIDTLLLSLVCSGTYDKKDGEKITVSDLAIWKSNPMEVYYQDAVKGLPATQVRYIQQHLIREDGSRRRVDAEKVKAALGEATYHKLTQGSNRLLTLGDKGQVELIHDQLGMAVYEERKAFEERERKRRRYFVTSVIILIAILFVGIGGWIRQQYKAIAIITRQLQEINSIRVADKALANEDSYLAQILAIEALPTDLHHPNRPYTPEAEKALRKATSLKNSILKGHSYVVSSVAFSPDDSRIVSTGWDCSSYVWDVGTGMGVKLGEETGTHASGESCFSPDGKYILTVGFDVKVFDAESLQLIKTLDTDAVLVESAAYSPDGKSIYVSTDKDIQVFDAITFRPLSTLGFKNDKMTIHSFSPDGKKLCCFEKYGESGACIIDIGTGEKLVTIDEDDVNAITFNPTGEIVATASYGTVKLWNSRIGELIRTIEVGDTEVSDVIFSPNGDFIATASWDEMVRLWRINQRYDEPIKQYKGHDGRVLSLSFNSDGSLLASSSWDKTVRIWDIFGYLPMISKTEAHYDKKVYYSPDGEKEAVVSWGKPVKMISRETGAVLFELPEDTWQVHTVDFSPDGKTIATASQDYSVRVWDANDGRELMSFSHGSIVYTAVFSPDGRFIASGTCIPDRKIRVWDVQNKCLYTAIELNETIYSLAYSPDGHYLACIFADETLHVYETTSWIELVEFDIPDSVHDMSAVVFKESSIVITTNGYQFTYDFPPLQDLIDQTRERFKDRPLTPEERKMYYLE